MSYKKYAVSELFGETVQGEGHHTGAPTAWVRFFSCNFKCLGFGQSHLPREEWKDPANEIDLSNIKSLDELPLFLYGCDSAYSHYKRFRNLAPKYSASEICDKLEAILRNRHNPEGKFFHPKTKQNIHMAFTGGEPMLQQTAIVDIMEEFEKRDNVPLYVTIETNGTQPLREPLKSLINRFHLSSEFNGMIDDNKGEPLWFWSCSPKLSSSGESWKDAIKPSVLKAYNYASSNGQLKYVVDGLESTWAEVERATQEYRDVGINWPVWIMPVGATEDQQRDIQAKICEDCFERGYNFSARLHNWIFGNIVGK